MKNKIISISIILVFIFTSLISTEAIAPTPRIELDEYQLETTDVSNVFVTGSVTLGVGQQIGVYDSTGTILLNWTTVANSKDEETFKVQIFARDLKEGDNTFKVKSLPLKGVVNSSNPKTVNVKVKSATPKKDQLITVSNLTLKVGETKSLNAKVDSGLPLTYISQNPTIATVDSKGKVIGRSAGTTKVTVKQAGNDKYNPASKTISVTVKAVTPTPTPTDKGTYTVVFNPAGGSGKSYTQKIEVGKSTKLSANKFSRNGYKFMGWADANGKAVYAAGQHIESFKNVNMDHFQLGKVKYKNKASVKNLAAKGKTIQLYAVWKGNGPQAAVDWGILISKDNNFCYGKKQSSNWRGTGNDRSHRLGCYFCGTNRNKPKGKYRGKAAKPWNTKKNYLSGQSTDQKYDKTYCCNPFVVACYVHGANEASKCHGGSMSHSSWTKNKNNGKFKKISKSAALQPGDIFFSSGHVWMCGNKNSKGQWTTIDASGSSWKANSISIRNTSPKKRASVKGRVRYYPNN